MKAMLLHEDRLFPAECKRPQSRPLTLCTCPQPAHRQPARTYAGGMVCRQRAVSRSGDAVCAAGPLRVPHALQPGRLDGRSGDRAAGDEGSAQGVAHFCQPLLSVPRHADADVAGLRVSGTVWTEGAAEREDGRSLLRHHRRETEDAGVSAAGALRKVQH